MVEPHAKQTSEIGGRQQRRVGERGHARRQDTGRCGGKNRFCKVGEESERNPGRYLLASPDEGGVGGGARASPESAVKKRGDRIAEKAYIYTLRF